MKKVKDCVKKFIKFLNEDSWSSFIISLLLLIVLIKFIIFPTLSFITASPLPLVVVESCSMYHSENFEKFWSNSKVWYENKDVQKEQFEKFTLKNGFSKGDIIIIWGRFEPKIGDIIVFEPGNTNTKHPIIHRIVSLNPIQTKGDNNDDQLRKINNNIGIDETNIPKSN